MEGKNNEKQNGMETGKIVNKNGKTLGGIKKLL